MKDVPLAHSRPLLTFPYSVYVVRVCIRRVTTVYVSVYKYICVRATNSRVNRRRAVFYVESSPPPRCSSGCEKLAENPEESRTGVKRERARACKAYGGMGIVQSRGGESDGGVREVFVGGVKAGVPHHSCQPSLGMGSLGGPHTRSGSVRSAPRQPMPDTIELERRFTKVLVSTWKKIVSLSLSSVSVSVFVFRSFIRSIIVANK